MRAERHIGPLLPFEELEYEASIDDSCKQQEDCKNNTFEDCALPNPSALLHVTSRRKVPSRKKSIPENNELAEMRAEFEDLLLKYETERTMSEIQIDYLTRKLAEVDFCPDVKYEDNSPCQVEKIIIQLNTNKSLRESEAILVIKQLQEKITMLEMEKSSSQQNWDCVVELATEQNICAMEKYEELYEELLNAQEEAKMAREQLTPVESLKLADENFESLTKLLAEVHDITLETKNSRISSFVDELFLSFSTTLDLFADLKSLAFQNSVQTKSVLHDHEKLQSGMRHKVNLLENEKLLLYNQSIELQSQIQELSLNVQNSTKELTELYQQHELEKSEFLIQIQTLQKEISCLSSSSSAREKENMRKDLEKTKTKLRETEFKLRNAIQEKTKLEGEKACAERELKQLHGQKVILERDISKRDSIAGKRRDSVFERGSNIFDSKKAKGLNTSIEQTMQEDYKKLEVLAFEMETTIASLEEELAATHGEKEEAISRTESLASELQTLSDKLIITNSELNKWQEEVSRLRSCLEESVSYNQKLETSIKVLAEEKEDLALQLTDALLAMEEEKAIWSAKEKASIEAIEDSTKLYNAETAFLSDGMSEVRNELESCREECKVLGEKLKISEETAKLEIKSRMEKSSENEQLRNELRMADDQSKSSQESLKSKLEMLSLEHCRACEEVDKLQIELSLLSKENENLVDRVERLDAGSVLRNDFQLAKLNAEVEKLTGRISSLEVKMHNDEVNNNKEKAKLRMRLRGAQTKLDVFRVRYMEAVDELEFMNMKYAAASAKLKDQLASYGVEVLNLKKQLATTKGQ
ncbi:unnamed protein product [Ilex paraguariensis]|uniref:Uncharacterized protein n=1 Tax=Ilex paraguariensis TaxID=185542 RepID=A0ABC8USQ2_9AQUA